MMLLGFAASVSMLSSDGETNIVNMFAPLESIDTQTL
jgi:hypothetical protein